LFLEGSEPMKSWAVLLLLCFLSSCAHIDSKLRRADGLYAKGDYPAARAAYQEILRSRPDEVAAYCGAGTCLIAEGRIQEAAGLMQEAVRIPDAGAEAYSVLGQAWYWDACSILGNPGDPRAEYTAVILGDAEANLKKAVNQNSELHLAHNFLGKVKTAQGKSEEAAVSFKKAADLKPTEASYLFDLGGALEESEKFREAAKAYWMAAGVSPEKYQAYIRDARVRAACCLARAGDPVAAYSDLETVYLEDPKDVALFQRLWAMFGADEERQNEGLRLLEVLIRLRPNAALPYYYMGFFQQAQGRNIEARKAYEKVLTTEEGKGFASVWATLGTMYLVEDRDLEQADRHLFKALELEPKNAHAYQTLTYMVTEAVRDRDLDRAMDLTRTLLKSQPENGHQWSILGGLYSRRRQAKEAIECYEKADKFSPGDAFIKMGLAMVYNMGGEFEKSEATFKESLALDPNLLGALKEYGFLCRKIGKVEKTVELWKKVLELDPDQPLIQRQLPGEIEKLKKLKLEKEKK